MGVTRRGLATVGAVLVCCAAPAGAATPASGTLTDVESAIFWTGELDGAGALPETCAGTSCEEFALDVSLPAGALSGGGLQIGVRWPDENQDVDLYVFGPGGEQIASSARIVSTAESVLIPGAGNGRYRVVAVSSGPTTALPVEGVAEVEFPPPVEPLRDLLPDLTPQPPRNLHLITDAYLFNLGAPSMPGGCYPEERLEQGAKRCLRFDQAIANIGDGAFELRYRLDGILTNPNLNQRIYRSDGTYFERKADTYEFHPAHAHFHYKNFAQARLWRSNAAGERIGSTPLRTGRKNGFCMEDVDNFAFGEKGDAARTYTPPECLTPAYLDPASGEASMVNGISVGWADVYNWFLADQFIEISGVPDGYYLIESITDPLDTVVELQNGNNSAFAHIRLRQGTATVVGGG